MIKENGFTVKVSLIAQARDQLHRFDKKTVFNNPTGDFFYDPWVLKDEYVGTVWDALLNSLRLPFGEARLIILDPGESYMAHADIDDRYHLNISGNNSFLIDLNKQKMHILEQDGKWYDMDAGKIHTAGNYGEIPRAQLVVRKLLKRGRFFHNYLHVKITPQRDRFDYRYHFDTLISPWLNKVSKDKGIDNFKFNNNTVEFDMDSKLEDQLKEFDHDIFCISYE